MSRNMTCFVCGIEYHTRDYGLPLMCDNCKVITLTVERDRYRDALERIAELQYKFDAGLSNAWRIANNALDGDA